MRFRKALPTFLAIALTVTVACSAAAGKSSPADGSPAVQGQLNINTADAKQLTMLPGVGRKTAGNIVAYRNEHGEFKAVDDLVKVRGFGKKTLEKCRGNCILEGKSTLVKLKK